MDLLDDVVMCGCVMLAFLMIAALAFLFWCSTW
jgi:hypothetical protein